MCHSTSFPFTRGSGWVDEVGSGDGLGHTVNVAVPPGTRGDAYDSAFARIVVPVLGEFAPDWILVSAGYDAHCADPLADVGSRRPTTEGCRRTSGFNLPVVAFSGGYHLEAIEASVAATPPPVSIGTMPKHRPVHLAAHTRWWIWRRKSPPAVEIGAVVALRSSPVAGLRFASTAGRVPVTGDRRPATSSLPRTPSFSGRYLSHNAREDSIHRRARRRHRQ